MGRLFFIIASLLTMGLVCLALIVWRMVASFLEERRQRRLFALEGYSKRLQYVVERLLARADEIDQEQKYLPQPVDLVASRRLATSCTELVVLGDSLKLIDSLIRQRDVRRCRDTLLRSCRIAVHVARELECVRAIGVTGQD